MSRESLVFILGIIVILSPVLGIPESWKTWGVYGTGVLLVWCGYSLRRSRYLREISNEKGEYTTDSFTESSIPE